MSQALSPRRGLKDVNSKVLFLPSGRGRESEAPLVPQVGEGSTQPQPFPPIKGSRFCVNRLLQGENSPRNP